MQYQKMTKSTGKIALIVFLQLIISLGCAVQTSGVADSITTTEPMSLISFGTLDSEQEINKLVSFLNKIENPKQLQLECDKQSIAKSCYYYASYYDLILKDYKESYDYYKKAYNLGIKQAGYFVGVFQINYSGIFDVDKRLSIDESIHYLEQAFKAGSPDATRILMMTYRDLKLNRIDYDKSEYYNKIAIKQEVKHSRYLLAYLYTNDIKDKSKIDKSIKLYEEDLMIEQNWQSALALMNIYLDPEEYGAKPKPNLVKTLAYAYVSSDLRKGQDVGEFNNVDTRFAKAMQTELSPETLKKAKAMYFELMAKMGKERTNLYNAIPKDD
ncbi:sel1 repeat family protein [Psychrobacter sp. FME13]|uniref:sel1 repeat family protein n=1 Tax=Psychrobacter sp. FME13 TaxID=2487708 RepID=UPI00178873E3|nr:sel1 repeat family protein [Psychrobacter sp. FME13]MBE0441217.1 sel1 repeat family protein [Psychrobacter sp. FME13]